MSASLSGVPRDEGWGGGEGGRRVECHQFVAMWY